MDQKRGAMECLSAGIPALLILLGFLVVDSSWKMEPGKQATDPVEAVIAEIKARHEPWGLINFQLPKFKPEDNAARLYLRAMERLAVSPEEQELITDFELNPARRPTPSETLAKIDAILLREAESLRDLHAATTLPGVDWEPPLHSPSTEMWNYLPWGKMFQLVKLSQAAAIRAHQRGDERGAVAHLRDILGFSQALRKLPTMFPALMATSCETSAYYVIQGLALELKMDGTTLTREEILTLINQLQEERDILDAQRWAIWGERSLFYELMQKEFPNADTTAGRDEVVARMLVYLGNIANAQNYSAVLHAFPREIQSGWESAKDRLTQVATTALMKNGIMDPIERAELLFFRSLFDRRTAATAWAVRLYAAEHQGRMPPDLSTLVAEKYLTYVPADPFAEQALLGYIVKSKQPRLYSVGEDGVDDHGSMEMPNEPATFNRLRAKDLVCFLDRPASRIGPGKKPPLGSEDHTTQGGNKSGIMVMPSFSPTRGAWESKLGKTVWLEFKSVNAPQVSMDFMADQSTDLKTFDGLIECRIKTISPAESAVDVIVPTFTIDGVSHDLAWEDGIRQGFQLPGGLARQIAVSKNTTFSLGGPEYPLTVEEKRLFGELVDRIMQVKPAAAEVK